jgi:outer membrane protein
LALAEQELMLRVAQTYFDVLLAEENIRVADAQLKAVNEQLVLAERNFAVGTGIVTDVYEAKSKRGQAQSQRITALNELVSKQAELEKIIGTELQLGARRLTHNLPPLKDTQQKEWLNSATLDNWQVRIQKAIYDVATSETTKSQSAHAPTLDVTANRAGAYNSGSLSSPADLTTRTQSHQVGVQLTVPLYAGGAVQSKVRESLLLEDKAYEDLVAAKRSARVQVRQSFAGVMNGMAQIEALQSAVEFGAQAVEANKIGFRIGTRINPDVLNAEQQLYAATRDLMKARVDVVIQGLKLKAAAGIMQEQDLAALDALFKEQELNPVTAVVATTSPVVFPTQAPSPIQPVTQKRVATWKVKSHGAVVRLAPSAKSELLLKLGEGSVVTSSTEPAYPPRFEYWRHVVVGNVKGWMASDALEPSQLPPKTVTYP